MALGQDGDISISSIGFASDGSFHIRFAQEETVSPITDDGCPFRADYYLHDPENPDRWPEQSVDDIICTAVDGGWDLCLPSLTPNTLEYLDLLYLTADYSAAGGRIDGNWEITVPVEVMDLRTAAPAELLVFPYTQDGEQPYGCLLYTSKAGACPYGRSDGPGLPHHLPGAGCGLYHHRNGERQGFVLSG